MSCGTWSTVFHALAGPYAEAGRCVQRPCWGGIAIDAAPERDGWAADVYAPGKLDDPARTVWAPTQEECLEDADAAARRLGWDLASASRAIMTMGRAQ